MTEFYTRAGEPTTLEALVREEPEWAASRIREGEQARFERDELLAIIHRDGGHYLEKHGAAKAVPDAHAAWAAVVAERDRLRGELEALRDEMLGRVETHHLASMRVASDRMYASRAEARGRRSEAQHVSARLNAILRGGES